MARTGSFGRMPRTSPSLGSTIFAMLREYQSMREKNIREAWSEGGLFEGHKVTDAELLKFYDERMASVDKDDPLYDEYKNTRLGYEFSIENSKMELKYAQKKVNDNQMSAFYATWGKKLPVDSEGYRQRMLLSAQYHERWLAEQKRLAAEKKAKSRGGSRGGSKTKGDPLAVASAAAIKNNEFAFDTVIDAITGMAQRGFPNQILNTLDEDLTNLRTDELDASNLIDLFNTLATDPGLAEYRANLTTYIRQNGDPNFNGDFSYDNVMNVLAPAKKAGLKLRIDATRKYGNKTENKAVLKEAEKNRGLIASLGSTDERQRYEEARADWESVNNDPNATLVDKWDALTRYRNEVEKITTSVQTSGDTITEGRLRTELSALYGDSKAKGPTLSEEGMGKTGGTGGGRKGDASTTAESVIAMQENFARLTYRDPTTGKPMFVQVRVNGNLEPTADQEGIYDVVPIEAVEGTSAFTVQGSDAASSLSIGGVAISGGSVVTAVVGTPVNMVGVQRDERDQVAKRMSGSVPLGMRFTLGNGENVWSFIDSDGMLKYSTSDPFTGGDATLTKTKSGDVVTRSWAAGEKMPKALDYKEVMDPDIFNSTTNNVMPSTVVNSFPAAEMILNPEEAYAAKPDEIKAALLATTNGNPDAAATLYSEVDGLRAAFVQGGDYSALLRLTRARATGALPLTADYTSGPGESRAEAPSLYGEKEQAAIDEAFAGKSNQELLANVGSAWMKSLGLNVNLPGSTDAKKLMMAKQVAGGFIDLMTKGKPGTTVPSLSERLDRNVFGEGGLAGKIAPVARPTIGVSAPGTVREAGWHTPPMTTSPDVAAAQRRPVPTAAPAPTRPAPVATTPLPPPPPDRSRNIDIRDEEKKATPVMPPPPPPVPTWSPPQFGGGQKL